MGNNKRKARTDVFQMQECIAELQKPKITDGITEMEFIKTVKGLPERDMQASQHSMVAERLFNAEANKILRRAKNV